jgi:hypothetical protein
MKRLTSRVLFKASPMMLAVALGLLGPAAVTDDDDDGIASEAATVPASSGLSAPIADTIADSPPI